MKKQTTTRPNLPQGKSLYALAKRLFDVKDADTAAQWIAAYSAWRADTEEFLAQKTYNEESGRWDWTHARLVTARNGLDNLIRKGHLFTFADPELVADGALPTTNNKLEGGVNAQLRGMLRKHRGMSALRRAKAAFWWCYMHSECPMSPAELLKTMPTDDTIAELYRKAAGVGKQEEGPQIWGDGLVWSELHHSSPWRSDWN